MCLKLIKSGQVVHSQVLKGHFLNMAKEVQLLTKEQLTDTKKLDHLRTKLDEMIKVNKSERRIEQEGDIQRYFKKLDKKFNSQRAKNEEGLKNMFEELTTFRVEDYSEQAVHTSIMQKALKL